MVENPLYEFPDEPVLYGDILLRNLRKDKSKEVRRCDQLSGPECVRTEPTVRNENLPDLCGHHGNPEERKEEVNEEIELRVRALEFAIVAFPTSNLDFVVLADKIYRFMRDGSNK